LPAGESGHGVDLSLGVGVEVAGGALVGVAWEGLDVGGGDAFVQLVESNVRTLSNDSACDESQGTIRGSG
jgi:hypothetical protein